MCFLMTYMFESLSNTLTQVRVIRTLKNASQLVKYLSSGGVVVSTLQ